MSYERSTYIHTRTSLVTKYCNTTYQIIISGNKLQCPEYVHPPCSNIIIHKPFFPPAQLY